MCTLRYVITLITVVLPKVEIPADQQEGIMTKNVIMKLTHQQKIITEMDTSKTNIKWTNTVNKK